MTAYSSSIYAQNQPAGTGHGIAQITQHLHATSPTLPTTLATNDTINMGYIPKGAVVLGLNVKAPTQLDSSTGLVIDVGDAASSNRYMAGSILVGRAAGASVDTTMPAAGKLFKTTGKTAIIITINTQATTAIAGTLELEMSYFVEDAVGTQA